MAQLALWSAAAPGAARAMFRPRAPGRPIASEPWGRIERLSERVWALISTPLAGGDDAMRTFANGGIVAGTDGVLLVEGLASDAGARWLAETARELTGRPPTHVVLTHYHGDHSAGLGGYRRAESGPTFVTTDTTRSLVRGSGRPGVSQMLESSELIEPGKPRTVDLGGARVVVTPRSGHTASDLTVAVEDPGIVFCGDLWWNGFFPNFRDTAPSQLSREVRTIARQSGGVIVPGHGAIPTPAEARDYVSLLDHIEEAARRAFEAGTPADAAARELKLPEALSKWVLFSDSYYRVALGAWERELVKG